MYFIDPVESWDSRVDWGSGGWKQVGGLPEVPQLVSGKLRAQTQVFWLQRLLPNNSFTWRLSFFEVVFLNLNPHPSSWRRLVLLGLKEYFHSHLVFELFPRHSPPPPVLWPLVPLLPLKLLSDQFPGGPKMLCEWTLRWVEIFSARLETSTFPKSYTYTVLAKSHEHVPQDGA